MKMRIDDDVLEGLIEWCGTFHAKVEYKLIVSALLELQESRKRIEEIEQYPSVVVRGATKMKRICIKILKDNNYLNA